MENIGDLWSRVLSEIEKKISKPSFETWLKSTKAFSLKNDILTIIAPNEFARDWLESKYSSLIMDTVLEITGAELEIKFILPQNHIEEIEMNIPAVKEKVRYEEPVEFGQKSPRASKTDRSYSGNEIVRR